MSYPYPFNAKAASPSDRIAPAQQAHRPKCEKEVLVRRAAQLAGIATAALALAGSAHAAGEAIELRGIGAQVYTCEALPSGFGWRLKSPEATLLDDAGAKFGRHFTGPSWKAGDGSTVVGEVVAHGPAPQPGSIPWLLLRAKSHSGSGAFASVGYIARIRTEGGVAPASGCDATHTGVERRVPYSAFYVFFSN
jgi:hypothetical protein